MHKPIVVNSRQIIDIAEPKPQNSHPRLSARRVLYTRFLQWLAKASSTAIFKALTRTLSAAALFFVIFMPETAKAAGLYLVTWNSSRIPIFCIALALMLNLKRLWRLAKAIPIKREARGNQYTFEGVSVPSLAQFLMREKSFKQTESIKRLSLTQGQYARISEKLEHVGLLFKDPQQKNARVLRPIELEELGTILRAVGAGEPSPLVYDEERQLWAERDGAFNRWVLSREFERRKLDAEEKKAERRVERYEEKAAQLKEDIEGPFAHVFSPLSAQ